MNDDHVLELVNRAVEVAVQRVQRSLVMPSFLFGSVTELDTSGPAIHEVLLDGNDDEVAAMNVSGLSLAVGDRVAVAFAPPHQLWIIGGASSTVVGSLIKRLIAEARPDPANLELANFTNIPATPYRHLQVVFFGLSDTSADAVRNIQVRLNGDSGNNYSWQLSRDAVSVQGLGTTGIRVGELDGAGAGHVSVGTFDLLHYNTDDVHKVILSQSHAEESANIALFNGAGQWNSSAVVDTVRILTDSASTQFDVGSRALLYGW